ncbi:MAG: LacI family transcriptional regulator [Phycicoccus sp.]|nr:LacI family transcriptional regulator [Phycicoccus sp.]
MTEISNRASGRVTRNDVARYAGVSSAVVSYVLNDSPKRVAPETRARVLEAVRVLRYRPNAAARALNRGSMEMLGLLVPDSRNPFFAELCHMAESVADDQGRALLVINVEGGTEGISRHVQSLASRQVDGLLIASYLSRGGVVAVDHAAIPTVLLNQFGPVDGLPTISVSFEVGARRGVEHLIEHGHEDIAFVGGGDPADGREIGWLRALTAAGLRPGRAVHSGFSPTEGYRAGRELLAGQRRPSAVFVASDYQAIGVIRAVHEAGLRMPEDIALVSFDGTPGAEFSWPPLTTVAQPMRAMVTEAIRQLIVPGALTAGPIEFPMTLVTRGSCGLDHGADQPAPPAG